MSVKNLNLEKYRLKQDYNSENIGVKKHLFTVPVKKPSKSDFVRTYEATEAFECLLLENKDLGELYLVEPEIIPDISQELIPKRLYLAMDRQNNPFIWPVKVADESGKLDAWNQSAHEAARIATSKWVRVSSNRSLGAYEAFVATGNLPEPEWPDLPFEEILSLAFRGKIIDSLDHPALKRLRGEI